MSFKEFFQKYIIKKELSFIGWALFIIALIGVCTYIARTKLNAAEGALREMENHLKKQPIQVQSAVTTREINNYPLVDFYVAGSYNSCCSTNTKDNEVSLEPLKMILKRGIRAVDFEIYMLPDRSVVIASGHNPLIVSNPSECNDVTITQKGSYNHVNISRAFDMINSYGFSVAPNSLDPIFINLRIKTKEPRVFNVLKKEIKRAFGSRLLPTEYAKEGKLIKPQRKKLEKLLLKDLRGKVIIMVEDYCQNYKDNGDFHQLVNMAVLGNLRKFTNDTIKFRVSPEKLSKDNKEMFAICVPDDKHPTTQLESKACRMYGCQYVMMNYGLPTDSLNDHMKFFRENGTQIVLKPPELRSKRVTGKKPRVMNKAGEGLNKTKKRVDPTTGKAYTF